MFPFVPRFDERLAPEVAEGREVFKLRMLSMVMMWREDRSDDAQL